MVKKTRKERAPEQDRLTNIPSVDEKNRIILPSTEWSLFLEKNKITDSNFPKKLAIVLNDTVDGLWGMTDEMFEKLATKIRQENRDMINFLYKSFCSVDVGKDNRRTSALTQLQGAGIIDFASKERFQIVCSHHQDYPDNGYFLRFTPIRALESGGIEYPNIRDRILRIFGTDFYKFFAKMQG